jgi:hypothetical protein
VVPQKQKAKRSKLSKVTDFREFLLFGGKQNGAKYRRLSGGIGNNMCNIPLLSLLKQILKKYADNPHCLGKGVLLPSENEIKSRYTKIFLLLSKNISYICAQ